MRVALRDLVPTRWTLCRTLGTHDVDAIGTWRLDEGPTLAVTDGVPLLQARVAFRRISEVISHKPGPQSNVQVGPLRYLEGLLDVAGGLRAHQCRVRFRGVGRVLQDFDATDLVRRAPILQIQNNASFWI